LIGLRSGKYGSSELIVDNGQVNKIGTKFGYTSWHPSGKVVVYSINRVYQLFHHARKDEYRDVIDIDSALAYYDVDAVKMKRCDHLSKKNRLETYPAFSSDGKYLYYCSAPKKWSTGWMEETTQEMVEAVKYDLMRISYDLKRDKWGQPEVIVSAEESGKSSLQPRVSPDGRWLLFCMCDYSCFPVYQPSSDLYMIDLESEQIEGRFVYRKLDVNSRVSESWHSWSSNSRWIAFSSKRMHGSFTRTYFSYIDVNGIASKPFVLPQKDPCYYEGCLRTFSVPELVVEPVRMTKEMLGKITRGKIDKVVYVPISSATIRNEQWQERE
jgi:Tol biopolymer transport system component